MSKKSLIWILVFLFTSVIVVAGVQLVRQSKPLEAEGGWRFQVAYWLDKTGDLYHAQEELMKALKEPDSAEPARDLLAAIGQRKTQIDNSLAGIEMQMVDEMRKFKRPKLWFLKGVVYELAGDDAKAEEAFLTSIEKKDNQSMGYLRLGLLKERQRDLAKAEEYFQIALTKNDPAFFTHFHYGMFLARTGGDLNQAQAMAKFVEPHRPVLAKIIQEKIQQAQAAPKPAEAPQEVEK